SIDSDGKLTEGAFYVWDKPTLQKLLNDDFELFSEVFNISEFGYWEHGNYVLIQTRPLADIAEDHQIGIDQLRNKKQTWEKILFQHRADRIRPRLDDKCLTSWNGLMTTGLIDAFKA